MYGLPKNVLVVHVIPVCFRGELGSLNCNDICMCVAYVDLQYDEIYLTFTAVSVSLCCVGSHVMSLVCL